MAVIMDDWLMSPARIEQTRREFRRLQDDVKTGLADRRKKDTLNQYQTQLTNLEQVLADSLDTLGTKIGQLDAGQPYLQVYTDCQTYDLGLLLLRRVLDYYQDKYDQRDDPRFEAAVKAADEVVWSCYAGVVQNATGAAKPPKPVPLPYIEPQYSPKAVPRSEPPPGVRADPSDLLGAFLKEMPIPIVSLPPICVEEPWWLIYLGHELGHHVQYDLASNPSLVEHFKQLLGTAVKNANIAGLDAEDPGRWRQWNEEIFADICSVYCMGHWAARAMVELLLADETAMLSYKYNSPYPSAVVRLELLATMAERLGLSRQDALGSFDPQAVLSSPNVAPLNPNLTLAKRDLALVPVVIDEVRQASLAGLGTFADLYDWRKNDFAPHGDVATWTLRLRGQVPVLNNRARRTPRLIISAAIGAWVEVAAIGDATQREDQRKRLSESLLTALHANREEADRAAAAAAPEVEGLGNQLTEKLLKGIQEHS
jgi:hypothetical protein